METKELPLVNFEQAKKLKSLGFDWKTDKSFFNDGLEERPVRHYLNDPLPKVYPRPTVALALKWIRDEKKLRYFFDDGLTQQMCVSGYCAKIIYPNKNHKWTESFTTYEQAESALLDELLTYLEKQS